MANFEMRHMDKAVTDQFYADIQAFAKEIPNCEFEFVNTSAKYSTPCDPRLIKLIDDVCTEKESAISSCQVVQVMTRIRWPTKVSRSV